VASLPFTTRGTRGGRCECAVPWPRSERVAGVDAAHLASHADLPLPSGPRPSMTSMHDDLEVRERTSPYF